MIDSLPPEVARRGSLTDSPIGLLTVGAFGAFLLFYAVLGQRAAAIAFWSVLLGAPGLFALVSAFAQAWSQRRRQELLEMIALAQRLADEQPTASVSRPIDDVDSLSVRARGSKGDDV